MIGKSKRGICLFFKGEYVYFLKVSFLANPSLCGDHVDDNHLFRG